MSTLQDRMREAMRRRPDLSQADLARACKVKTPSVADWLNGKTKSLGPEPARLAAKLFGCDRDWIGQGLGAPQWQDSSGKPPKVGVKASARNPDLAAALPVVLQALATLTVGQWHMVRARLDDLPEQAQAVPGVLADVAPVLGFQVSGLEALLARQLQFETRDVIPAPVPKR